MLQKHSITERGGPDRINFARYVRFAAFVTDLMQFGIPNLSTLEDPAKLAYMRSQLQEVRSDAQADDEFETRSLKLAEGERKEDDLRVPELKSLGFRI